MSELSGRTVLSSSPHIVAKQDASNIMLWVVVALVPSALWAAWSMGAVAIIVLTVCIVTALGTEGIWNWAMKRPQTLRDGSALVTGLILALSLPPATPWWIAMIAAILAIALAKMLFGGLGWNLFNPALVGRGIVVISWAGVLSELNPPGGWYEGIDVAAAGKYDAITGATRLAIEAADRAAGGAYGIETAEYYRPLLLQNLSGSMGEISALLLVLGGLLLIAKGIIDWRIPAGYIGTVAAFSWLVGADPVFHILAGGVMLGAFFMATDYVTSPMTRTGRLIFAVGCGLINSVGRFYGPLPEATTWAILFMNGLVPLIDRYTRPRTFGWVKKRG